MPDHPPAKYRQSVVRGDTFVWSFTFKQGATVAAAAAVSVATDTWVMTWRDAVSDSQVYQRSSGGSGIELDADSTTGLVRVTVDKAVTATWTIGTMVYDIERTTAAGVRTTYVVGPFVVREDRSR